MNHEVEVTNLMFNKTSDEPINFKKYDINVDLEEESSNEGKTILKYSLDLTSNPKNSVINISGSTILSGEQEEIEDFLKQENEKTPEVVSLIYQELFPLMYIVTKNMKIPAPSHTISQSQIMESENANERITNDIQSSKEDALEVTESDETNLVSDSSELNLEKDDQKENSLNEENKS
jgi:hypothetical protein